jgi:hypothetical protein
MIKKLLIIFSVIVLMNGMVINTNASYADNIENTRNGIVEIKTGVIDQNNEFIEIKNASGFIVKNDEDGAYIITTNTAITLSNDEVNKYKKDTNDITKSIRVIIKGDVSSEVSVLGQSNNQDFCILHSDSVINEKEALKLGNSSNLNTNDEIYSIGYSNDLDSSAQFVNSDVEIHYGTITQNKVSVSDVSYIEHTATIDNGNTGGALLNQEGYVVGMNNMTLSKDKKYYSLAIDYIKDLLDNYGITYDSYDLDQKYEELDKLYNDCLNIVNSKKYTSTSLSTLETAMESAKSLLENKEYDVKNITSSIESLNTAKNNLKEKTSKILICNYILGVVICGLIIRLIQLLFINKRINLKKKSNKKVITKKDNRNNIKVEKNEKDINHENNIIIDDNVEDKTIVLSKYDKQKYLLPKACLLMKDGMSVEITKPNFIIGKSKDNVDCTIDNKYIGRIHATIKYSQNNFYIYDMNSLNGTYVNDKKVDDHGMIIKNQDRIVLANETIIFVVKNEEGEE